jgi:hypothetical protein
MNGNPAVPGGLLTSKPTRSKTPRVFGRVGFLFEPHRRAEDYAMNQQIWVILLASSVVTLSGLVVLWLRMPLFRWSCRRCKKIVSISRFRPAKCSCGTQVLAAYFCKNCASWNTTPRSNWHCVACSSKDLSLGVEYKFGTGMWRTRNVNAQHSMFHGGAK